MKTVGIILGTIVVTIGLIVSIVLFNFQHAKDQQIVVNFPKSKVDLTIADKNDSTKVVTSIHTTECEIVELANKENKFYQIGCDDGSKDGFTVSDLVGKQKHSALKVGDTVIVTRNSDGIVNVRLVNK